MANIELHRTFHLSGTNIEDFFDAVQSMEKATKCQLVHTDQLAIGQLVDCGIDARDIALTSQTTEPLSNTTASVMDLFDSARTSNKMVLYYCAPNAKFNLKLVAKDRFLERSGMSTELYNDLTDASRMLLFIDRECYIVSELAHSSLNSRASLSGNAMIKPTVGRACEIAKSFFHYNPQTMSLVTRSQGDTKILIAAHSEKYCYVPQTIVCDIYDKITAGFGQVDCLFWEVSHERSHCYVGFPEIAKTFAETYKLPDGIIPGLFISTSDSGDGAITVRGIWNVKGHMIGGESISRYHRGDIDIAELVSKAQKTIFEKYTAIPERLAELLTITVPSPRETIKSVFKQIQISKSTNLGKKNAMALYSALISEFLPGGTYTAYDVALAIASAPDRCATELHYSTVEKLQNLAKAALFADYTKTAPVEEEFILV